MSPARHSFSDGATKGGRSITIRPASLGRLRLADGETYCLADDPTIDPDKVVFTLDYKLHNESFYKVQNTNSVPVTIEIHPA